LFRALAESGIDAARITTESHGFVVPIAGDDRAAELLARLVRAGIPVVSFAPAVGDLEHTFLDLSTGPEPSAGAEQGTEGEEAR
jgi:hypothetical protein